MASVLLRWRFSSQLYIFQCCLKRSSFNFVNFDTKQKSGRVSYIFKYETRWKFDQKIRNFFEVLSEFCDLGDQFWQQAARARFVICCFRPRSYGSARVNAGSQIVQILHIF